MSDKPSYISDIIVEAKDLGIHIPDEELRLLGVVILPNGYGFASTDLVQNTLMHTYYDYLMKEVRAIKKYQAALEELDEFSRDIDQCSSARSTIVEHLSKIEAVVES